MSEILSPHITASGVNTYGTLFDIKFREGISDDPQIQQFLMLIAESIMVVFPKEAQTALEDSIIAAIQEVNGRFNNLNLLRVSADASNAARLGTDGGVFVPRRTVSGNAGGPAATAGTFTLTLPAGVFADTEYDVSLRHLSDPGTDFRWWETSRSATAVSIGFAGGSNTASFRVSVQS